MALNLPLFRDMPHNCLIHLNAKRVALMRALLMFALAALTLPATAARPVVVNTTITNGFTRYLTNVIEVSVPNNVFVDEFRTNWIRRDVVNVINVYQTNIVPQYRTNLLTVARYATNLVTAWHTNVNTLTLTNWENFVVLRTNWVQLPVTNVVESTRTNYVTITVTNWQPVTVITTNVVPGPVVGAVRTQPLRVTAPAPAPVTELAPVAKVELPPATRFADLGQGLQLDLAYVGSPKEPGQFPIRLTLLSASGAMLAVSEWRVEKTDGGGLMIGAKPEFSSTLPAGNYRVTARVRAEDGTVKTVRGNIDIRMDAGAIRTPASIAAVR